MRETGRLAAESGQSLVEYGLLVSIFAALTAAASQIESVVKGFLRLIGL